MPVMRLVLVESRTDHPPNRRHISPCSLVRHDKLCRPLLAMARAEIVLLTKVFWWDMISRLISLTTLNRQERPEQQIPVYGSWGHARMLVEWW
jgi:hypothetical protein